MIVLANRAPFRHERAADGRVTLSRSSSGVVTALEPFVRSCGGTWVAHGAGSADQAAVGPHDCLRVPPENPTYRLRYVWLEPELLRGFYHGFSNEGLWPLCHDVGIAPVFRDDDYRMYEIANARFASAVVHEASFGAPLVLVQDYHFALAPALVRRFIPNSRIVAFWHIPWPSPRMFQSCPFAEELVAGLLGSDTVGLQTSEDCENFLGSAEAVLGATIDRARQTIEFRGGLTRARVCPAGVETGNGILATTPGVSQCRLEVRHRLQLPLSAQLCIGVDRLDFTKGLNHKFIAIERLLELRPDLRGTFALVQIAAPGHDELPAYRIARAQLLQTASRINGRFGTSAYTPIQILEAHHDAEALYRLYRAADVFLVSSLRDGMNLVAKEFVAAREDERGVLVLSKFAGASQQLRAALLCDPFDVDQTAQVLSRALTMSAAEQSMRMRVLRANVSTFDATWWTQQLTASVEASHACIDSAAGRVDSSTH